MELHSLFATIKRDYDSCDDPKWFDPATLRTLDQIKYEIALTRITKKEFADFVDNNLGCGEFAIGCKLRVLGYI